MVMDIMRRYILQVKLRTVIYDDMNELQIVLTYVYL